MPAENTNPFESPATRSEVQDDSSSPARIRPATWVQVFGGVAAVLAFLGGFLVSALAVSRLLFGIGGLPALVVGLAVGIAAAW